jgi:hypothetical protein
VVGQLDRHEALECGHLAVPSPRHGAVGVQPTTHQLVQHHTQAPHVRRRAQPKLGCGVAQLVVHRLAVRQARVRFSARHPMEVLLLLSEEAMRIYKKGGLANSEG